MNCHFKSTAKFKQVASHQANQEDRQGLTNSNLTTFYIKSGATGFENVSNTWNGIAVTVGFYTVVYETKNGSTVTAHGYVGNISEPVTPIRSGYTFIGWSATDGGIVVIFPYSPDSPRDITLYAKWKKNPVKAAVSKKPSIIGKATATAKAKNKLIAQKGIWSGYPVPVISYQWYSCTLKVKKATTTIPRTCKRIPKATKSKLAVTISLRGKFVAVAVIGKSNGTSATKWLSASTAKVKQEINYQANSKVLDVAIFCFLANQL